MAVSLAAAAAFHWFGVDYAAGAPVDVTGWSDRAIAQLIKKAPVVAAASGGSSSVAESWLTAYTGGVADPSSLSIGAVVGSDLEIDGTDATKINILTDGFYTLAFSPTISPSSDAAGNYLASISYVVGDVPYITNSNNGGSRHITPGATVATGVLVQIDRLALAAGQQLTVTQVFTATAGTVSDLGGVFSVVRVP